MYHWLIEIMESIGWYIHIYIYISGAKIICICRLCLGAWSDHGERTGGFYACNRYETAKQEGVVRNLQFFFGYSEFFFLHPSKFRFLLVVWWGREKKRNGKEFFGEIHSLLWTLGKQSIGIQFFFLYSLSVMPWNYMIAFVFLGNEHGNASFQKDYYYYYLSFFIIYITLNFFNTFFGWTHSFSLYFFNTRGFLSEWSLSP